MPIDALVHLDRLRCVAEHDGNGHSEPYLWAVLLWVDDTTISSGRIVGSTAPGNASARLVVKDGMRAGEDAPVPSALSRLGHRFDDGLSRRDVALVVALLEHDELPAKAARAGYDAFVREVPQAVVDFALSHGGQAPETPEERQEVADAVRPKVESAIRGALSGWEKFQIAIGSLDVDDQIGFDAFSRSVDAGETTFTLRFEKTTPLPFGGQLVNHYELDGHLELRQPPPPDPCQAEVDALRAAQAHVNGLQSEIAALQAELHGASPSQKAAIIAAIRRIRETEIPPALAEVERAAAALDACRDRPHGGPIGPIEHGGVLVHREH